MIAKKIFLFFCLVLIIINPLFAETPQIKDEAAKFAKTEANDDNQYDLSMGDSGTIGQVTTGQSIITPDDGTYENIGGSTNLQFTNGKLTGGTLKSSTDNNQIKVGDQTLVLNKGDEATLENGKWIIKDASKIDNTIKPNTENEPEKKVSITGVKDGEINEDGSFDIKQADSIRVDNTFAVGASDISYRNNRLTIGHANSIVINTQNFLTDIFNFAQTPAQFFVKNAQSLRIGSSEGFITINNVIDTAFRVSDQVVDILPQTNVNYLIEDIAGNYVNFNATKNSMLTITKDSILPSYTLTRSGLSATSEILDSIYLGEELEPIKKYISQISNSMDYFDENVNPIKNYLQEIDKNLNLIDAKIDKTKNQAASAFVNQQKEIVNKLIPALDNYNKEGSNKKDIKDLTELSTKQLSNNVNEKEQELKDKKYNYLQEELSTNTTASVTIDPDVGFVCMQMGPQTEYTNNEKNFKVVEPDMNYSLCLKKIPSQDFSHLLNDDCIQCGLLNFISEDNLLKGRIIYKKRLSKNYWLTLFDNFMSKISFRGLDFVPSVLIYSLNNKVDLQSNPTNYYLIKEENGIRYLNKYALLQDSKTNAYFMDYAVIPYSNLPISILYNVLTQKNNNNNKDVLVYPKNSQGLNKFLYDEDINKTKRVRILPQKNSLIYSITDNLVTFNFGQNLR
jgi:hypothetical protein